MEKHRLGMGVTCRDDREVHGLQVLFPLQNLLSKIRAGTRTLPEFEEPIRAELFSSERLEQHAESLTAAQSALPARFSHDCNMYSQNVTEAAGRQRYSCPGEHMNKCRA